MKPRKDKIFPYFELNMILSLTPSYYLKIMNFYCVLQVWNDQYDWLRLSLQNDWNLVNMLVNSLIQFKYVSSHSQN